jgi:predicted PurR-regulated permease PerM
MAVIFNPIASRLEKFLGRPMSGAIVVMMTVTILAAIGYPTAMAGTIIQSGIMAGKLKGGIPATTPNGSRIE